MTTTTKRSLPSTASSSGNAKRMKYDYSVVYEYDKYVTTSENLRSTLDEYGVAIIPYVLDEKECSAMHSGLWDFFEHISSTWDKPLNRNDVTTYKEFYRLIPMHSMLVQYYGIGHAKVSWDLRQNTKVIQIFADFWKCKANDLLVSFDAASFSPPPEITNRGWNRNKTWYHTDQSYTRSGFSTAQAWATSLDVLEGDATLAIMESSHKYHQMFATEFKVTDKSDWYKLNKEQEKFYFDLGCHYRRIKCPKGSMVFWDSRTIHCGVEAMKGRSLPTFRSIIYLCYAPRSLATAKDLEKKRKAIVSLRTTSHYPYKAKLFGKQPQHYGKGIPAITPIPAPILSALGVRLAGF